MKKKRLTLTNAFGIYGAQLKNPRWAFSAIAADGSMVLSCWNHFLKSYSDGHQRYEDRLSRWDSNTPGKQLLIEHLQLAFSKRLPVRLIVATLEDPAEHTNRDASSLRKSFSVHRDLVGKLVQFDGNRFAIDFKPM